MVVWWGYFGNLWVLMPPEPLPWDRKELVKERKQERERSESLGSVARWRDSSHHPSRDFNRWGSDFRRPSGDHSFKILEFRILVWFICEFGFLG